MKRFLMLALILCFGLAQLAAFAQDRTTEGAIGGRVVDTNGAAVPNAKITVTGALGERTVNSNEEGVFSVANLKPGTYNVKVELAGFKSAQAPNVTVFVGKESTLSLTLEPGNITEVIQVTDAASTDLSTTSVGENLNDQLFQNIPVQRSVTSLFYLAPGATDSIGGGRANPSISGGSALDNLYVADGVNITDSSFGGLGTFARSYGSLGTGINTSFIKEVQVKTGGFEPQYGQAEGGIVNIITKSGSNGYHGALYGYALPKAFEGERRQRDNFSVNKVGQILHEENYDAGADFGGHVPGLRDKLFFFGSFNPTVRRELVRGAQRNAADIANNTGRDSGLFTLLGDHVRRYRTLNYAFKLDYNLNANNQLTFSIFGDPSQTNLANFAPLTQPVPATTLNIDNTTSNSQLNFGTRSTALRYNGAFGSKSPLTVQASFSQGRNHFDETGFANFNQILDRTQPARGNFIAIGRGFVEPTRGTTYRTTIDIAKQTDISRFHLGTHTFGIGYTFQRGNYAGTRDRSGPKFAVPAANAIGTPLAALFPNSPDIANAAIGQTLNAQFSLRVASNACALCPVLNVPGVGDTKVFLRQDRGEFGNPVFSTFSNYHAAYVQDTIRVNRFVTGLLGLRMEQERLVGNPRPNASRFAYSFTDQFAPRLGVTVDPLGRGKTKIYYNYGRFFEYLPLDLAERQLSEEKDFTLGRYIPEFTIDTNGVRRAVVNAFGTVNPIIDAAHFITGTPGAGGLGQQSITQPAAGSPIIPGTKLGFADEHIVGFEQQLPRNFVISIRYLDRRLKRIIEDASLVSPEASSLISPPGFIGNISSRLDAGINPIQIQFAPTLDSNGNVTNAPATCFGGNAGATAVFDRNGALLGGVCIANGANAGNVFSPDGKADGFPDPVRNYKALEIELNKRFSNNYQLLTNFRIASLRGNYEGHFRNDNGQTDPGISSLFDFAAGDFNLLGDQFAVGPLNTDRRFVSNIYGSYLFSKGTLGRFGEALHGLNLGAGLHMESGVPYSKFAAHPVYANAGEIPLGGRGSLGRSAFFTQLDLHGDFPYVINERMKLSFVADVFNVFNTRTVRLINQNLESTLNQPNPDFGQPVLFHLPINLRLGLRFEF